MKGPDTSRFRSVSYSDRLPIVLMASIIVMGVCLVGIISSDDGGISAIKFFTVGDIEYEVLSDTDMTVEVYNCMIPPSELIIPAKVVNDGLEYTVTSIGNYAFSGCTRVTSLTIPDSVTTIQMSAFSGCTGLTTVTIPATVNLIGDGAFSGCTGLKGFDVAPENVSYKEVDGVLFSKGGDSLVQCPAGRTGSYAIPHGVKDIKPYAFHDCAKLTSVTIPSGVTDIGLHAFWDCTGLASIAIPDGVTSIGDSAFSECRSLKSMTIPSSVDTIGSYAFNNCSGLASIVLSEGIATISVSAFFGCTGLTSVTIPASVSTIFPSSFSGCTGLVGFAVDPGNANYCDVDGCLFTKDERELIQCPGGRIGHYAIPEGTSTIGYSAFSGCTGLTSVTIPDSVTTIGNSAFYDCAGLTSVTIPSGVSVIALEMFWGCTGLTSVTLPDHITSIGPYAFWNCAGLTSFDIPASVTSIEPYTFYGCTGLTSITLPSGVTDIGFCAFYGCTGLTSLAIPSSVRYIGFDAFYGCTGLTGFDVHPESANYRDIEGVLFSKDGRLLICYPCGKVGLCTIPEGVTDIDSDAFIGCIGLTGFDVHPENANYRDIEGVLFSKDGKRLVQYPCGRAGPYTVPEGVTDIDREAFTGCALLTAITLPSSASFGYYLMFLGCDSLTDINLAEGFGNGRTFSKDGAVYVSYNEDTTLLYRCPEGRTGSFTLPHAVNVIGPMAFVSSQLDEIVVSGGSTLYVIHGAFEGCNPELKFVSGIPGFDLEVYSDVLMTDAIAIGDLPQYVDCALYLKWVKTPVDPPSPDEPSSEGPSGHSSLVISGIAAAIAIGGAAIYLFMRRRV